MPGVLPVLNQEAVRMAVMFGLAIDAEIGQHNVFARKNYFYPDLPKGYQISQMELPIVGKGHLDIAWKTARSNVSASPARTWKKTPARACTKSSAAPAAST
jgi:Asp-tRNA(Asn)/Glu-tRNA(Gln) amidotransferase B subunit